VNLASFIAGRTIFPRGQSFVGFILRLAVVAYALSITVMIVASGLIRGFKTEISEKMFGCWGHIHIVKTTSHRTFEQEPLEINPDFYPDLADLPYVSYAVLDRDNPDASPEWKDTHGGVKSIQLFANVPGIISNGEEFEGVILKGVDHDYSWDYFQKHLQYGSLPDISEDEMTSDILISRKTADRMRLDTGRAVIVHFIRERRELKRRFRICGIYNTGLGDFDNKFALIDIKKARQVLKWEENWVGGYEVYVDDLRDVEAINTHIYQEVIPTDLISESIKDKFPNIFDWLELQDINEWVIMGLMLLVAMINLIIMLLIIILERTKLIGVMKAIGSTDWTLRKVFLYKAAMIMILGSVIGNILGIGLCLLQQYTQFIKLDEESYFLSYAPIHLDPWIILLINLGAIVLCLTILIIPSALISRMQISKVLRFR